MNDRIEKHYDSNIAREINRLNNDFYSYLEKKVVLYLIEKYFSPHSKLIDIGGGPGSYSRELMDMGFDVTLVDISQKQVDYANEKYGHFDNFKAYRMDAMNLSEIDIKYDCIMLLGPLYHLLGEEKHIQVINECKKIMKKDGVILASAISHLGTIRGLLNRKLYDFFVSDEVYENPMVDYYNYKTPENHSFIDFAMTRVKPLKKLFERNGFKTISMAGTKGIFAGLTNELKDISDEVKEKVVKILINTCEEQSIIGCSEHILYVGQYCG